MKSFWNVLGIVCLGIILVAGANPVRSQEATEETTQEEAREQERLRDRERILENESKILEKYSERFGVDTETLADLRAQRLGYGEISHVFVLSEMTERSQNEIIAMRRAGKGWGQIADECGVKLRKVRKEVKRERRRIKRELTRQERRTLRRSWKESRKRAKEIGTPRPKYKEKKPGKEYRPEKGRGKGSGRGRGR
ncbi:hypothetical protein ES705_08344 [subsurface metagenome]